MRTIVVAALALGACAPAAETRTQTADVAGASRTLKAEVWVDNWFALYANGRRVLEDSVPITTERSFNAETTTFSATLPMTIAFEVKDFKENDTGLEYIGTNRQQVGDGGMIAQFTDPATGETVAVTDAAVRCLVVHRAPVDLACANERNPVAGQGVCGFVATATPANWTAPGFDDSSWPAATEHSVQAVSPKDGYDTIRWDPSARLIWSADLKQDNTLLCRMTIGGPGT